MKNRSPVLELENVLAEEIRLYENYREQIALDDDLMSNLKIDELEISNKVKETIVLKVHALEQARQQLVHRIAQEKGLQKDKVRLRDLCSTLASPESQRLMNLRSQLVEVVEGLKESQVSNQLLARNSLNWIEGAMTTLKNLLSPSGTYDSQGNVGGKNMFSGHTVESKA